jgi:hypothetical protein
VTPQRSTQHATFDIERVYDASPAQVFGAWAGAAAKAKWFGPSEPDASSPARLSLAILRGFIARKREIGPRELVLFSRRRPLDATSRLPSEAENGDLGPVVEVR